MLLPARHLKMNVYIIRRFFFKPMRRLTRAIRMLGMDRMTGNEWHVPLIVIFSRLRLKFTNRQVFTRMFPFLSFRRVRVHVLATTRYRLGVPLMTGRRHNHNSFQSSRSVITIVLNFLLRQSRVVLARLQKQTRIRTFTRRNANRGHTNVTLLRDQVSHSYQNSTNHGTTNTNQITRNVKGRKLMTLNNSYRKRLKLLLHLRLVIENYRVRCLPFRSGTSGRQTKP